MNSHNHPTRDVKSFGNCPGCDSQHYNEEITLTKKALIHLLVLTSKEGAEYGPLTETTAWYYIEGLL